MAIESNAFFFTNSIIGPHGPIFTRADRNEFERIQVQVGLSLLGSISVTLSCKIFCKQGKKAVFSEYCLEVLAAKCLNHCAFMQFYFCSITFAQLFYSTI